ncbi:IS110 family transposase [Sphingobacterium cellulitidis]|uniref:Transposase IS116/IS110/IS902 C-terminal domain-containing protein n=1 Tax=Sphingobacterium cellulitidis TaxID=1768011 RepID=A0A8H9FYL7_9SPHI|nr:IS110 family transposase [Sphingobacterium soli]MBA8986146.1 transposase [Sphingobacterium soli]GGE17963.1 hypothetical protein GCM10011516_14530 [Sphingobacterium soli]
MEDEVTDMIKNDESMLQNYRIISSIKGIGPVIAWMKIAYIGNFTSFTDARKYTVYVGVIPFEHTSGSSIKGRKRLSHIAHKELKNELNQAAKAAMTHESELNAYAERKLKDKAYHRY